MHNNNIVVAVKVNGRVLREANATVTLPFGSEFSLLIKNLHSVRTQVAVSIDGQSATGDNRLILQPNSSLDLERFIRDGNLHSGNKFKFIERTPEVEAHRGIGAEDGLVRVEAWREVVYGQHVPFTYTFNYPYYPINYPPMARWSGGVRGSSLSASMGNTTANYSAAGSSATAFNMNLSQSDAGITVAGAASDQQFHSVSGFPLEATSTVVVLRLRGAVAGEAIQVARTVEQKPKCVTCGRVNKATNQFCGTCGTALTIL